VLGPIALAYQQSANLARANPPRGNLVRNNLAVQRPALWDRLGPTHPGHFAAAGNQTPSIQTRFADSGVGIPSAAVVRQKLPATEVYAGRTGDPNGLTHRRGQPPKMFGAKHVLRAGASQPVNSKHPRRTVTRASPGGKRLGNISNDHPPGEKIRTTELSRCGGLMSYTSWKAYMHPRSAVATQPHRVDQSRLSIRAGLSDQRHFSVWRRARARSSLRKCLQIA
jgi:hypothetical protein